MANLTLKFAVVGPVAPADFKSESAAETALNAAYTTITDASATSSLVSSEPIVILGNVYMILTYYA